VPRINPQNLAMALSYKTFCELLCIKLQCLSLLLYLLQLHTTSILYSLCVNLRVYHLRKFLSLFYIFSNKLECLYLADENSSVYYLWVKSGGYHYSGAPTCKLLLYYRTNRKYSSLFIFKKNYIAKESLKTP